MNAHRREISEKILYIRNSQGITRERFAEAAELSVSYLYQLESGKKSIGLGALIRVAQVLQVTLDELVEIDTKLSCDREKEMLLVGLIRDCSEKELNIIIENARNLKVALRKYKEKM